MKWDRKRELRRAFDAPMPGGRENFWRVSERRRQDLDVCSPFSFITCRNPHGF